MRPAREFAIFCMASTALAGGAFAQATQTPADAEPGAVADAPSTNASNSDADIIVTAQRREERLVDVPIAVSAVSTASLERAGVQNLNSVQALVPNVQFNQTVGNSFSPLISIRGVAPAGDTSLGRDQPVGIYLDGVPVAKSTGAAFDVVDLQRIEVLRGPQGTLYGKNTIGGAVNLVTQEPTGEFGGQLWLSYGEFDRFQRRLTVDLPALGAFKLKLGYSGNDQGGYWRNAANGKDYNEQSLNAYRADLLWEPSDNFSARYVYDISDAEGAPPVLAINAIGTTFPAALRPLVANQVYARRPGRDDIVSQSANQSDFRTTGHSLTLNYDLGSGGLGDVTVRSITARRTLKTRSMSDFDGTVADLLRFTLNNDYKAFSQELQVIGSGAQVKYTLGAFYLDDDYDVFNPRWNFQLGRNLFDFNIRGGGSRSVAGYGQFTWTPGFAERNLDLSVGLRYTSERKKAYELLLANSAFLANPAAAGSGVFQRAANGAPITRSGLPAAGARPGANGIGPTDLSPLRTSKTFNQFNPEFNLVYRLQPDWSVYGRVATGFKSGGINDTAATNAAFLTPYDPEKLLSFEAGTKFLSTSRVFALNLSVYHSIYKDFQAGVFVPELVTTNIINAGKAKFTGVEVEGSLRPFEGLALNFGGGYLDARYSSFILPSGQDVTDTYKIPLAPKWNYLVGGVYRAPLGFGTFELTANWNWRSSQWSNILPDPLAKRKGYGTLDGRIGITDIEVGGGTRLEFAVFGRNITDEKYWNSAINLGVLAVRQWADPQVFGVEGRVRF